MVLRTIDDNETLSKKEAIPERRKRIRNKLTIPTTRGTLDAFNTRSNNYSNGDSEFQVIDTQDISSIFALEVFSYLYQKRLLTSESKIRIEDLRSFMSLSRGGKSYDIRSEIVELSQKTGSIRNSHIMLMEISFVGRFITIKSDYMIALAQAMNENSRKADGRRGALYCSLVYADIIKCRNSAASEIAIEICKLIERRGPVSEGRPAHLSTKALIDRCPTLWRKFYNAKTVSRRNQIIRDDLARAKEIILRHTTIFEVFQNLVITWPDRSQGTQTNACITIYHDGRKFRYECEEDIEDED